MKSSEGFHRAKSEILQGQRWKALDRLLGCLSTDPADRGVIRLIAQTYFEMGQLPEAGRYWLLTTATGPEVDLALEAFHSRYGTSAASILQVLPLRTDFRRFPGPVVDRLDKWYTEAGIKTPWGQWTDEGVKAHKTFPSEIHKGSLRERVGTAIFVAALVLLTVGVWAYGVLHLLAHRF